MAFRGSSSLLLLGAILISHSSPCDTLQPSPGSYINKHKHRRPLAGQSPSSSSSTTTATLKAAVAVATVSAAAAVAIASPAECLEIAQRAVMARPFISGALLAGTKGALADWVSQRSSPRRYDGRRTISFFIWNTMYCGVFCYIMYSKAFPWLQPILLARGVPAFVAALSMVLFDNFVATPFVCLPSMYLCIALVDSTSPLPSQKSAARRVLSKAVENYSNEWRSTLLLSWSLWIPIHCVTFSVVPAPLRVHFTACCSFLTLMAMSRLVGVLETRRNSIK